MTVTGDKETDGTMTATLVAVGYVGVSFLTSVTDQIKAGDGTFIRLDACHAGKSAPFYEHVYAAELRATTVHELVAFVDALPWRGATGVLAIESEWGDDDPVFAFPGGARLVRSEGADRG